MKILNPLGNLEVEIAIKQDSMLLADGQSEQNFRKNCVERLNPDEVKIIDADLDFIKNLSSVDPNHPTMAAYINHPIRVADFVLRAMTKPIISPVRAALVHNVFEVGGQDEKSLSDRYPKRITDGIRLLTINRDLQRDPPYLIDFYKKIMEYGDEYVLIRSMDKIDNLLAFRLIKNGFVRESYLEITREFVIPFTKTLHSELAKYMESLILYMEQKGPDITSAKLLDG